VPSHWISATLHQQTAESATIVFNNADGHREIIVQIDVDPLSPLTNSRWGCRYASMCLRRRWAAAPFAVARVATNIRMSHSSVGKARAAVGLLIH
jgi:hypothetical protein